MIICCNLTKSLTSNSGASFDKFNVALQSGGLSKFSAAATIVKRLQAAGGSSPLICLQLVYWKKAHMTIEQSHQKHHRLVPRGLVSMLPSPQN